MTTPALCYVPHDAFVADVLALARQIGADAAWRADFIVGVGRGGLVPGTFLSHATGLPLLSVDYSAPEPDFAAESLVKLAGRTRAGIKLLFVDDINDSGRTISLIRAALDAAGGVRGRVRFATLIDNVVSSERVDYAARTIDRTGFKDWFVFPWEAVAPRETIVEDAREVPARSA